MRIRVRPRYRADAGDAGTMIHIIVLCIRESDRHAAVPFSENECEYHDYHDEYDRDGGQPPKYSFQYLI